MPVKLKDIVVINHVNPALVPGEVYRIVRGYGAGRVFVVYYRGADVPAVQYLGGTNKGWDFVGALKDSQFVSITLQEV